MYCTQCGTANSDDMRFCMNCGAPMVKRGDTPNDRISPAQAQSPDLQSNPQSMYQAPGSDPGAYGGQGAYSQPAYAQSAYPPTYPAMPSAESASGRAVIAMVLSIISPFTCWPFLSIPGMILGKMEMNAIRNGQAPKAGETFAKIGFYVGLVITVLSLILPLVWLIVFVFQGFISGLFS